MPQLEILTIVNDGGRTSVAGLDGPVDMGFVKDVLIRELDRADGIRDSLRSGLVALGLLPDPLTGLAAFVKERLGGQGDLFPAAAWDALSAVLREAERHAWAVSMAADGSDGVCPLCSESDQHSHGGRSQAEFEKRWSQAPEGDGVALALGKEVVRAGFTLAARLEAATNEAERVAAYILTTVDVPPYPMADWFDGLALKDMVVAGGWKPPKSSACRTKALRSGLRLAFGDRLKEDGERGGKRYRVPRNGEDPATIVKDTVVEVPHPDTQEPVKVRIEVEGVTRRPGRGPSQSPSEAAADDAEGVRLSETLGKRPETSPGPGLPLALRRLSRTLLFTWLRDPVDKLVDLGWRPHRKDRAGAEVEVQAALEDKNWGVTRMVDGKLLVKFTRPMPDVAPPGGRS